MEIGLQFRNQLAPIDSLMAFLLRRILAETRHHMQSQTDDL
jgi:hypothetical protein